MQLNFQTVCNKFNYKFIKIMYFIIYNIVLRLDYAIRVSKKLWRFWTKNPFEILF